MSSEDGSAPVSPGPAKPAGAGHGLLAAALEREAARVFEYCRALIGREDDALSVSEAALSSARTMLQDPERLRTWLTELALRQAPRTEPVADTAPDQGILRPDSREVFELVYRHGIHREDLPAVLGVPADEASALLAAAELELGRREPPAEPDPAELASGPADLISGQFMLPDPDRLRAWLFALARQAALAAVSGDTAVRGAAGTDLASDTGSYLAATDAEPGVLPATWWQSSVPPPPRRRLRIAALAVLPVAAAVAVAVYLGCVSHPGGARGDTTADRSARSGDRPRSIRPNAGLAAAAPHASASPTIPISALLPVSSMPVVLPPPNPPLPAPSPTPRPTPKPSAKPSPTPTPKPSTKPSPTPTPKPSTKSTPTPTAKATPTPTHSAG